MTNKSDGEYLCSVPELNEQNNITISYSVLVKS